MMRVRETRQEHWPDDHELIDHSAPEASGWIEPFSSLESISAQRLLNDTPHGTMGERPPKESLMPGHPATSALFAAFLALNRKAFAAGFYHTAYHALAAALDIAHARQNAEGLSQVERLAVAQ
jgi:hypothetical protein